MDNTIEYHYYIPLALGFGACVLLAWWLRQQFHSTAEELELEERHAKATGRSQTAAETAADAADVAEGFLNDLDP